MAKERKSRAPGGRAREKGDTSDGGLSRRDVLRGGAAGALASGLLPTGLAREGRAADAPSADLVGPGEVGVELRVNGARHELRLEPRVTLLDALREHLEITGPKKVCDRATCGSCTVLEDGRPIYSCTRLAIEAQGTDIVTVEGLGTPENMHPVQRAFVDNDAQQCGYCTPGFVVACASFLEAHPDPSMEEIERGLGGNFCRCGTYAGIRKVLEGAKEGTSHG